MSFVTRRCGGAATPERGKAAAGESRTRLPFPARLRLLPPPSAARPLPRLKLLFPRPFLARLPLFLFVSKKVAERGLSPDEAAQRHELVVTCALSALAALLPRLASASSSSSASSSASPPPSSASALALSISASPQLWGSSLAGSKSAAVRAATYSLARALFEAIAASSSSAASPGAFDARAAAPAVLASLADKPNAGCPSLWAMVIAYLKAVPGLGPWGETGWRKAAIPRIKLLLRSSSAAGGGGGMALGSLLPLLSLMPAEVRGEGIGVRGGSLSHSLFLS